MSRSFNGSTSELSELRKNPDALRRLEAFEWSLSIPEPDYQVLIKLIPDLAHGDNWYRNQAWKKFIEGPISEPYRTRDRKSKISYTNQQIKAQEPTLLRGGHISGKSGKNGGFEQVGQIFADPRSI